MVLQCDLITTDVDIKVFFLTCMIDDLYAN